MKTTIFVLFSMLAYSYDILSNYTNLTVTKVYLKNATQLYRSAQTCLPTCANGETCHWNCEDSNNKTISNANITGCNDNHPTCASSTETNGTCVEACESNTGGNGSSKMELLTPLLVLGILAKLCFYP